MNIIKRMAYWALSEELDKLGKMLDSCHKNEAIMLELLERHHRRLEELEKRVRQYDSHSWVTTTRTN